MMKLLLILFINEVHSEAQFKTWMAFCQGPQIPVVARGLGLQASYI